MKRIIVISVVLLSMIIIGVLAVQWFASGPEDATSRSEQILIPEEFQPPVIPDDKDYLDADSPDALVLLADQIKSLTSELLMGTDADETISAGAVAVLDLMATGNINSYSAYRGAFACTLGPTAEPLADQRYQVHGLPGIDKGVWDSMSPQEKFDAVAANPDHRNATILEIAPNHAKGGLGQRGSIPVGYRVQGLKSAYSPPTPGLFLVGAETEWAWIEIPVKLDATDEAILRFEYVFDPTVNAWLLQRTSMLAPESVKLPWLVF